MSAVFRTILVPLDGSAPAEAALPYAMRLAGPLGAGIVLLRAALAHTLPGVAPATAQVQVIGEAEEYLAALEVRVRAAGLACRSVVPYGPAAESIVDNAALQAASLVVMSAHGRSGPGRWSRGGVADKVVQGLGAPVLLVQGPPPPGDGRGRALLPLDGSELAEAILPSVAALAPALGLTIAPLTIVPPAAPGPGEAGPAGSGEGRGCWEVEAREYLRRVGEWLRARSIAAAEPEVRVGAPAEEILDRSAAADVGLVAVSSHGRSGVGRWVYGSVADRVLHQSECPILLFRAPGARPRSGEPVRARRCHNCGRETYRLAFGERDICPLCGFSLRACANCVFYDGVVCSMGNPWSRSIYAGTPCPDFEFRETTVASPSSAGK